MPYEHQLKMIVDGFANTSHDFATWAKFLDLRVDALGFGPAQHFHGAPHVSPPPNSRQPYALPSVSLQNAATLLADIADCQAAMLPMAHGLNLRPADPDFAEKTLGKSLTDSQLLLLILNWQHLDIGIFKTFMRLYGLTPTDLPPAPQPGPSSEKRLCAVIVSWLEVINADVNSFVVNQNFLKKTPTPVLRANTYPVPGGDAYHDALANLEKHYHRLVDNYLLLLTVLPYHLLLADP
ncbi:MAG: hypothetical protein WA740_02100 [Candidatus Binataceae bacterium]